MDDEADSRDLIAFVVEQAGASAITAATAAVAIATLMQSHFDVLLSDIGMPDMDGYMLMRQVRLLPPEQGGTGEGDRLNCLCWRFQSAAGVTSWISAASE